VKWRRDLQLVACVTKWPPNVSALNDNFDRGVVIMHLGTFPARGLYYYFRPHKTCIDMSVSNITELCMMNLAIIDAGYSIVSSIIVIGKRTSL
jgi:hypothetical protein